MKFATKTPNKRITVVGAGPVGIRVAQILIRNGLEVIHIDSGQLAKTENEQTRFDTNMSTSNKYFHHSISPTPPINPWGGCLMGYRWQEKDKKQYKEITDKLDERVIEEVAEYFSVPQFNFYSDDIKGNYTEHFHGLRASFGVFTPDPLLKKQRSELESSKNYTFVAGQEVLGIQIIDNTKRIILQDQKTKQIEVVESKKIFLCCGTIENSRILFKTAEWNEFSAGNLGENLSDHLALDIGVIRGRNFESLRRKFGSRTKSGHKVLPRFRLDNPEFEGNQLESFLQVSSLDIGLATSIKNLVNRNKLTKGLARRIVPGDGLATILFETKPSQNRRLKRIRKHNSEQLYISFHIDKSEFDTMIVQAKNYLENLRSVPNLSVNDFLDNLRISDLRSSIHWSGTTTLGSTSILNSDLSTIWDESVYALGANVLPRALATHPTFISVAIAQVACEISLN
jgi:hypothetical protein